MGGYGRGELHPLSDIDILIVSQKTLQLVKVSQFITPLGRNWSDTQCVPLLYWDWSDDLTVATNCKSRANVREDTFQEETEDSFRFILAKWDLYKAKIQE